jgi:hypothetical protein
MVARAKARRLSVRMVLEPFSWPLWRFAQLRSLRERTDWTRILTGHRGLADDTAVSGCLLNMVVSCEMDRGRESSDNAVCAYCLAKS